MTERCLAGTASRGTLFSKAARRASVAGAGFEVGELWGKAGERLSDIDVFLYLVAPEKDALEQCASAVRSCPRRSR